VSSSFGPDGLDGSPGNRKFNRTRGNLHTRLASVNHFAPPRATSRHPSAPSTARPPSQDRAVSRKDRRWFGYFGLMPQYRLALALTRMCRQRGAYPLVHTPGRPVD